MRTVVRALFAFFIGIIWFTVCVVGYVLLALPQVITNLYLPSHKNVDWIDSFMEFMDNLFNFLKDG